MRRLIDANARIEEIKKAYCTNCESYNGIRCRACWVDDAIGMIDDAPTVDAVEVVHGRWNRRDDPEFILGDYECSACEYVECDVDTSCLEPGVNCLYYCPNCGAKMDGGNEDG